MAYGSDASGQNEVYVQPFPDVDAGRWQISTAGGTRPVWGPDGRELFFMTSAGVMGVSVETAAGFAAGAPSLVVSGTYLGTGPGTRAGRSYDIAPDGQRFLMVKTSASAEGDDELAGLTQIVVVQNWVEELQARVPTP